MGQETWQKSSLSHFLFFAGTHKRLNFLSRGRFWRFHSSQRSIPSAMGD